MNRDRRPIKLDEVAQRRWGCSHEQYLSLMRMKCVTRAFTYHRRNAKFRGIGFEMNLWEWWTIWQQSGHWFERGPGQGYVMCRKGDIGPYAVGNVFIAPAVENNSIRPSKVSGLPRGVARKRKGFVAYRMLDGKRHYLGQYPTPAAAHQAYVAFAETRSNHRELSA